MAKAVAIGEDRARRRMLRKELRTMIRANPLGDAPRFTRAFYAQCEQVARA